MVYQMLEEVQLYVYVYEVYSKYCWKLRPVQKWITYSYVRQDSVVSSIRAAQPIEKINVYNRMLIVLFILILFLQYVFSINHEVYSFTSFVFGDSLVDAGNNNYLFSLAKANSPPYGIDFKPSGGQPTGRFTNGRTISDILGK